MGLSIKIFILFWHSTPVCSACGEPGQFYKCWTKKLKHLNELSMFEFVFLLSRGWSNLKVSTNCHFYLQRIFGVVVDILFYSGSDLAVILQHNQFVKLTRPAAVMSSCPTQPSPGYQKLNLSKILKIRISYKLLSVLSYQ